MISGKFLKHGAYLVIFFFSWFALGTHFVSAETQGRHVNNSTCVSGSSSASGEVKSSDPREGSSGSFEKQESEKEASARKKKKFPWLIVVAGAVAIGVAVYFLTKKTPTPVITSFSATPSSIYSGGKSTLSWSTTDADSVTIDNGIGVQPVSGSVSVSPAVTTTYTITAQKKKKKTTQTLTLTVREASPYVGKWSGEDVAFDVNSDNTWSNWEHDFSYAVISGSSFYFGFTSYSIDGPGPINGTTFSYTSATVSFSGEFTSATEAKGTWTLTNYPISVFTPPYSYKTIYYSDSGNWTASKK